jgi:hypothetical protein
MLSRVTDRSGASRASRWRWPEGLAAAALVLLVAINLPLFLRMPVWCDVHGYDLCARNVLSGGVHYRDRFENNFPGILWAHLAVRSLLGWSSEAIRAADLVVVTLLAALLGAWWLWAGRRAALALGTAATLLGFYFATSESCHFQRDTLMLLPAVGALWLRRRQLHALADPSVAAPRLILEGMAEGMMWGAGIWLKPFVLLPALVTWLVSMKMAPPGPTRGRLFLGTVGLLGGGLLAGGLGIGLLWAMGSWPDFLDVMLVWNRDYLGPVRWEIRLRSFFWSPFWPWPMTQLLAVPLAAWTVFAAFTFPRSRAPGPSETLLSACYLGWVIQALALQREWTYVTVPAVMLAITVVAGCVRLHRPIAVAIVLVFLLAAARQHPAARGERLALWFRCAHERSRPDLRRLLALEESPDWPSLDRVAAFLREQAIADGDLLCYHVHAVVLYSDLGLEPRTRFVFPEYYLKNYRRQHSVIAADLQRSSPLFVVTHLESAGLTWDRIDRLLPEGAQAVPVVLPTRHDDVRPWSEPVVFRAGPYAVHRVTSRNEAW